MTTERIVIVAGPRAGKSWLAREINRETGAPVYCGDPLSTVKDPEPGVTYLPEGLGFSSPASQWIVDNWLPMPGPWILEGHVMARVLRKWLSVAPVQDTYPCDRIIVLSQQRPELDLLPGQRAMHRGVMTVWDQISDYFEGMYETRRWEDE